MNHAMKSLSLALATACLATTALAQTASFLDVPCSVVSKALRSTCEDQHKNAGLGPEEHQAAHLSSSAAAAVLAATPAPPVESVTVTYDRFKKQTKIELRTQYATAPHSLLIVAIFKGQEITELDFSEVSVGTDGWQYIRCQDMTWLVDDQPFQLPTPTWRGDTVQGATVIEFMYSKPTLAQMDRLAAAKKVEYKICNDEVKFTDNDLVDIHKFVERIHEFKRTGQ